jgi:hypothetical protein
VVRHTKAIFPAVTSGTLSPEQRATNRLTSLGSDNWGRLEKEAEGRGVIIRFDNKRYKRETTVSIYTRYAPVLLCNLELQVEALAKKRNHVFILLEEVGFWTESTAVHWQVKRPASRAASSPGTSGQYLLKVRIASRVLYFLFRAVHHRDVRLSFRSPAHVTTSYRKPSGYWCNSHMD